MEIQMINPWFIKRAECPACESKIFKTIYESPYDQSPIRDYLLEFYSPQGNVEFEYLAGAMYALCECNTCGLIC